MNERSINIDYSGVENIRFMCIEDCGKCCFFQAPTLTTADIIRIRDFLETKKHEDVEKFVVDWITYENLLSEITEEMVKIHIESIKWFWSPFQLEEAEEGILVMNYTVHSTPSKGRCKLLNPVNYTCFVYPKRPDACRLYPFTFKRDETGARKMFVAMTSCPGIGIGSPLNIEEIKETIQRGSNDIKKDVEIYEKYIRERGINRIEDAKRKGEKSKDRDVGEAIMEFKKDWREAYFLGEKGRLESASGKGKKFIEPFAEFGIISPHPLIVRWNKWIEEMKN